MFSLTSTCPEATSSQKRAAHRLKGFESVLLVLSPALGRQVPVNPGPSGTTLAVLVQIYQRETIPGLLRGALFTQLLNTKLLHSPYTWMETLLEELSWRLIQKLQQ